MPQKYDNSSLLWFRRRGRSELLHCQRCTKIRESISYIEVEEIGIDSLILRDETWHVVIGCNCSTLLSNAKRSRVVDVHPIGSSAVSTTLRIMFVSGDSGENLRKCTKSRGSGIYGLSCKNTRWFLNRMLQITHHAQPVCIQHLCLLLD